MTTFYFSIITRKGYYRVIPVVSNKGVNGAITEFGNMPYSGSNIVTITF